MLSKRFGRGLHQVNETNLELHDYIDRNRIESYAIWFKQKIAAWCAMAR